MHMRKKIKEIAFLCAGEFKVERFVAMVTVFSLQYCCIWLGLVPTSHETFTEFYGRCFKLNKVGWHDFTQYPVLFIVWPRNAHKTSGCRTSFHYRIVVWPWLVPQGPWQLLHLFHILLNGWLSIQPGYLMCFLHYPLQATWLMSVHEESTSSLLWSLAFLSHTALEGLLP